MARKAAKVCRFPGCKALTTHPSGYCEECRRKVSQKYNLQRDKAVQSLYGTRWQKARRLFMASNPLCKQCADSGRVSPTEVVDHIVPHKGDIGLFWDEGNWQPLCRQCHDRKTLAEDGGMGRPVRERGGGREKRAPYVPSL